MQIQALDERGTCALQSILYDRIDLGMRRGHDVGARIVALEEPVLSLIQPVPYGESVQDHHHAVTGVILVL